MGIQLKEKQGAMQTFKEGIINPLLLSGFEVRISGDTTRRLDNLVYGVDIDLKKFDIRNAKQGNRVYPWFAGRKEDAIAFGIKFIESEDAYVSDFFDKYYADIYDESGKVKLNNLMSRLYTVDVFQLDREFSRRIRYRYVRCLFLEDTNFSYAHDANDSTLILSFTVYARNVKRSKV